MDYADFYNIAGYLNEINRNVFSHREVAENAHIYVCDFEWSKANGEIANSIKWLAKELAEDDTEECKDWLYEMARDLDLFDMDYLDYLETDEDIIFRFVSELN